MKQRFTRSGDELEDDDELILRGGELDPSVIRRDAQRIAPRRHRCARVSGPPGVDQPRTMNREPDSPRRLPMTSAIDITADLNAQDDDGFGWSTLADAADPSRVVPGAMLLAGNEAAAAVVRVVAVDDDGQVHFTVLPGSVDKNRHLLGPASA